MRIHVCTYVTKSISEIRGFTDSICPGRKSSPQDTSCIEYLQCHVLIHHSWVLAMYMTSCTHTHTCEARQSGLFFCLLHRLLEAAKREYSVTRIVVKMQGLSEEKGTNVTGHVHSSTCSYSVYTLAQCSVSETHTGHVCYYHSSLYQPVSQLFPWSFLAPVFSRLQYKNVFVYCKQSKFGVREDLGTRLLVT